VETCKITNRMTIICIQSLWENTHTNYHGLYRT